MEDQVRDGRLRIVLKRAILRSTVSLQSDDRLVKLVREGVDTAFDEIVERYRAALLRYAARMVDAHRAEDIVQDALVKAHLSLLRDERAIQLKPWLYRITHNAGVDSLRQKHWNYEELDPNYDGVRQPPDYLAEKEQLWGTIEQMGLLPERERRALVLRVFEGRNSEEIARELEGGVPEVRQLVHRARVRLRDGVGALIPLPVILWLRTSSASAAAGSHSAVKLAAEAGLKGSFATIGAAVVAAAAIAAAAVVIGRSVVGGQGASKVEQAASPAIADGSVRSPPHRMRDARAVTRAPGARPDRSTYAAKAVSAPTGQQGPARESEGAPSDERAPDASPRTPATPDHADRGDSGGDGGPTTPAPDGSTGAPQAPTTPTDGGSGSGGGGNAGGGSGDRATCIGPIAQLPPICLPLVGGGGSGAGSLLSS